MDDTDIPRLIADSIEYLDIREDYPRSLILAAAEAVVAEMTDDEVETACVQHTAALAVTLAEIVADEYLGLYVPTCLGRYVPTCLVEDIRWRLGAIDQLLDPHYVVPQSAQWGHA